MLRFFQPEKTNDNHYTLLINDLHQTAQDLQDAYRNLENVIDPDLIDCYIYELNSVQMRYKFLLTAEHIDTVEILRHVIGEIECRYQLVNRALRSPQCFLIGIPIVRSVRRPGIVQICEKNIIHNHDQSAPVRLTDPPGKIYNLFFFQDSPPFSCPSRLLQNLQYLLRQIICLCQNRNRRLIEHILMCIVRHLFRHIDIGQS